MMMVDGRPLVTQHNIGGVRVKCRGVLTKSMAVAAKYSAYNTGALFDPDSGASSVIAGANNIPRSIASDGRRWVLFFHVIIHILAIAANVVNTVLMNRDFSQSQIKISSIVATAMHGAGVLALLALAAAEMKQVSFVVSMGLIYSFLVSALIATAVTATFTFRYFPSNLKLHVT